MHFHILICLVWENCITKSSDTWSDNVWLVNKCYLPMTSIGIYALGMSKSSVSCEFCMMLCSMVIMTKSNIQIILGDYSVRKINSDSKSLQCTCNLHWKNMSWPWQTLVIPGLLTSYISVARNNKPELPVQEGGLCYAADEMQALPQRGLWTNLHLEQSLTENNQNFILVETMLFFMISKRAPSK